MPAKRNAWHVNDPDNVLTNARRKVKSYKGLAGLKTEAEALAALVEAGYKALQGGTNETQK